MAADGSTQITLLMAYVPRLININSNKNIHEKTLDGQRFADNPRINDGLDGT